MYHVRVIDKRTRVELAKYSYATYAQAVEAARSVREIRRQNGERVIVSMSKRD